MTLPDLARYPHYAADTETTGTSFRDRAVGISVHLPDGTGHYIRWGHEGGGNNCTRSEAVAWANAELRGKESRWFNAPFDLRMLAYDGVWLHQDVSEAANLHDAGIQAPLFNELETNFKLDTLGDKYCDMRKDDSRLNQFCADHFGGPATRKVQIKNYWRAPGDMVEGYAIHDAKMTDALVEFYKPRITEQGLDNIYDVERSLVPMLLKMHMTGVRVNIDQAIQLQQDLTVKYDEAEHEWLNVHSLSGDERFIDSWQRLLPVFERYNLPISKTDKGNPSFAAEVLDRIDHPISALIRLLRQLKHYRGTFINNYILKNADDFGLVHGEFHSVRNDRYGTVSGRFSSGGELNLQNIPARDLYWAPLIRGLFIPLPGYQWGKIDYSQIEYRFFAHYCGGRLEQLYIDNPGIDFHQMMADLTGHPRKHAKNINFAALFGAGIKQLARMLKSDLDEARRISEEYHAAAPEVRDMTNKATNRAIKRGYIETWGGRKHRFPQGSSSKYAQSHKALNRLCQGSAADLLKYAMRAVDQVIDWEHVICHLTVHDELDFSVSPCSTGMKMFADVRDVMEDINNLGGPRIVNVPVIADGELGPDWGHCNIPLAHAA